SAGEAWRAPVGVAATIDVSDPTAFDVYLNGEHGGGLTGVLTPLNQLNARAAAMARETAARIEAQTQAAQAAAARAAAATQAAMVQTVSAGQPELTPAR
ncbi:MAG: helix-turn-helix domain-containing protein, partial [Brevundimonas sp.]